MRLLIKNGYFFDPANETKVQGDMLIENGKIVKTQGCISGDGCDEVIDVNGCVVAPGLVDVHVHFRDPGFTYKEDIQTGANAAKRGGFTTVIPMANTKPAIDTPEMINYIIEEGKKTGIRVYPAANVTMGMAGKELVDFEKLAEAGAVCFTDDGLPICDEQLVIEAMKKAAELGKPISFHEELPAFIKNPGVNHGKVSEQMGLYGAEAAAEYTMIGRDVMFALATGAPVDIQHISSKEGVNLVRQAKAMGADVHAEATPHHFTLTEKDVLKYGTHAKMNPPLRTEEDRMAIIEGLKDGTIDMIATDHAPHSPEEKEREFTKAPSGIIGLETSLSLAISVLDKQEGISLMDILKLMSLNPLRLYNLPGGDLNPGSPADLVIFNPDETWVYDHSVSKSVNSPFLGTELMGKIHFTICDGKIVYRG